MFKAETQIGESEKGQGLLQPEVGAFWRLGPLPTYAIHYT